MGILQARILEWVAMPSSGGSSRPRDQTCVSWVSCLTDGFFTTGAAWGAPKLQALLFTLATLQALSYTCTDLLFPEPRPPTPAPAPEKQVLFLSILVSGCPQVMMSSASSHTLPMLWMRRWSCRKFSYCTRDQKRWWAGEGVEAWSSRGAWHSHFPPPLLSSYLQVWMLHVAVQGCGHA